ncbi:SDR family oxidoreductase [Thauera sinica]|uniref:SDR family oxidoreductase n=1 Tax=Thauera sinica TaxID=2665146 RepID=A0ABW1ALP7_9RHOO|nr:SDR family oxidoreductase [Thauera sp. K11]ATE59121.1 UDP-glucose 4-epimerase [Thauera sp. K11]
MRHYFLTGASGAVGSAIVPLLLSDPDTRVRILLRADSDEHLAARLDELCRFWELAPGSERRSRIQPLRGDASLPRFGLADADHAAIAADTTHIIHCAASVRMNDPLDKARRSAVGSAEAILALARELARRGSLQKLDFVSTVGIAGKRPGILPETWIDEPRAFHNTYEQTKAEAETLVREAIERERLPITVHRPSMVIGDSRDGRIIHFQIFYYICEILSGRRTLGLYPCFGDTRLDIIPVDWVAEAIATASRNPDTAGRIFHLCSGPERSPVLHELKTYVRDAFRSRGRRIPASITVPRTWFAALPRIAAPFVPERQRRKLSVLPIYMDYLADRQGFDNAAYLGWLEARGRHLPGAEAILPPALGYYLQQQAGSQPGTDTRSDSAPGR